MKKSLLIIITFVAAIVFSACSFSLTKEVISGNIFVEKATDADFAVEDLSDEDGSYFLAEKHSGGIEIEFMVLSDVSEAEDYYSYAKNSIPVKGGSTSEVNAINYQSYKINSDGYYYVVYRIENTFLSVAADSKYRKEVSSFLKSIGY